jgi:hypothetical protein
MSITRNVSKGKLTKVCAIICAFIRNERTVSRIKTAEIRFLRMVAEELAMTGTNAVMKNYQRK